MCRDILTAGITRRKGENVDKMNSKAAGKQCRLYVTVATEKTLNFEWQTVFRNL